MRGRHEKRLYPFPKRTFIGILHRSYGCTIPDLWFYRFGRPVIISRIGRCPHEHFLPVLRFGDAVFLIAVTAGNRNHRRERFQVTYGKFVLLVHE